MSNTRLTVSKLEFYGCETNRIKCQSLGAGSGVIRVRALEGELGVIKKGETTVKDKIGGALWPSQGTPTSGSEYTSFECAGLKVNVRGSLIAPIASNAMKLTATIKFAAAKGVQKPTQFLDGPAEFLTVSTNGGPYEQQGQSATTIQTNEEKVEARSF